MCFRINLLIHGKLNIAIVIECYVKVRLTVDSFEVMFEILIIPSQWFEVLN